MFKTKSKKMLLLIMSLLVVLAFGGLISCGDSGNSSTTQSPRDRAARNRSGRTTRSTQNQGLYRYVGKVGLSNLRSFQDLISGTSLCSDNKFFGTYYRWDLFQGSTSNRCKDIREGGITFTLYERELPSDGNIEVFISRRNTYSATPGIYTQGNFVAVNEDQGFAMRANTNTFSTRGSGTSFIEVRVETGEPGDNSVQFVLKHNGEIIGSGTAYLDRI